MQASPAAPQRTWLKVLVALVIVALAVVGYMSVSKKDAIPDVTFTNLQGKKFTSQDLRGKVVICLLYTSPSPRDQRGSRMPSSA